jgi:release factor glutamine methyltransferase
MNSTEPWTIGKMIAWTTDYLKRCGSQSPRLDAEVLLAHARGCQRIELYTAFTEEPSEQVRSAFREMVRSRASGMPVAYLVGYKEFYSMTFQVNPDVLIPRPETEHLVVTALDLAQSLGEQSPSTSGEAQQRTDSLEIVDVGTGSGAIAIAIATHLPNSHLRAVDISPAALEVARRNAQRHGLESDRIEWIEGDLLSWCRPEDRFWLVVSNPPYVSPEEYQQLPKEVAQFEPRLALIAEPEGGSVIRRLVDQSARYVRPGGWLVVEFSPMLERKLDQLIVQPQCWSEPKVIKDHAGHARVLVLKRTGAAVEDEMK